jgi:predicted PhzF superfamily epimerase YddE/YHI9
MSRNSFEYLAEQGLEIGRPGSVTVKARLKETGNWMIQVGGQAVTTLEGEIVF